VRTVLFTRLRIDFSQNDKTLEASQRGSKLKINCKSCMNGKCSACIDEACLCREDHSKQELIKAFTETMRKLLPKNIDELKKVIKKSAESKKLDYDIDVQRTVGSDAEEFRNKTKGGFYAYEEKNSMQCFAKDFVSDIMLPAHVYNGKESCGKWKIVGCLQSELHKNGGGYVGKYVMRCHNKGCRKCATSAIKREAKSITDRLMAFVILKRNRKIYLKKNRSRILSHNVISIPFEEQALFLTKEGRKKLRQKALKILKQFDVDGGNMIDHAYRFTKGLESARFSPHFHFILTGWIDGNIAKEIYEKTNWIVTNISTIESWQDCYNLSKYLLSHASVYMKQEGKRSAEHSVRYFGECHNKKFKVDSVLKYSITGFDELDSIIYDRKELERKKVVYPLQRVLYTHSIIQDEIKDVKNTYFEEDGNPRNLSKSLRRFIEADKDNPAFPQSDEPSMEFLQMRFEYGSSQYDIVQSVYANIIFDRSFDCICPECTAKMETLTPCDRGWSEQEEKTIAELLVSLPEGVTVPFDDITIFDSLRNTKFSNLGMPFFDVEGKLDYDTGVYQRPECLESLNPKLYWSVIKNINTQKVKFKFKLENGRSPNNEELKELLQIKSSKTESQNLLNF